MNHKFQRILHYFVDLGRRGIIGFAHFRYYALSIFLIVGITFHCTTPTKQSNSNVQDKLKAIGKAPESLGVLIYEGAVFPIEGQGKKQEFSYTRRVKDIQDASSASHITKDAGHTSIIVQTAKYSAGYDLLEFEYINGQANYIANVEVKGNKLHYTLIDNNGKISKEEEDFNESVVVGPTLFGTISRHWDELSKGTPLYLRFVVAEKKQTYRFAVLKIADNKSVTRFEMKPTNWIIGLFIAPFLFDFDSSKRTIITYQGRVPPMRTVDGKLQEFDAKVFYTHQAQYH